jgi:uncharacterized membrane protein YphA (DoxX/SURF4 family)
MYMIASPSSEKPAIAKSRGWTVLLRVVLAAAWVIVGTAKLTGTKPIGTGVLQSVYAYYPISVAELTLGLLMLAGWRPAVTASLVTAILLVLGGLVWLDPGCGCFGGYLEASSHLRLGVAGTLGAFSGLLLASRLQAG